MHEKWRNKRIHSINSIFMFKYSTRKNDLDYTLQKFLYKTDYSFKIFFQFKNFYRTCASKNVFISVIQVLNLTAKLCSYLYTRIPRRPLDFRNHASQANFITRWINSIPVNFKIARISKSIFAPDALSTAHLSLSLARSMPMCRVVANQWNEPVM